MDSRFWPICCALLSSTLVPWAFADEPAALQPAASRSATLHSAQSNVIHATAVAPVAPPNAAIESAPKLAVLRNGEVMAGRITNDKDRYVLEANGFEIRLPVRDVDFVCRSLDEAYAIQQRRAAAGRVEDRLRLANWCLRQQLLGYAAAELAAAMETNPRHPDIAILDRRLRQAVELAASSKAAEPKPHEIAKADSIVANKVAVASPTALPPNNGLLLPPATPTEAETETTVAKHKPPRLPPSAAELDRLSRSLPGGTLEQFTETIQPLLINSCSTVGCHGPASKAQYGLIRPASSGRVPVRGLSQRNLFNTLEWIDHKRPADSDLLTKAKEPHGGKPVAALTEDSFQYRQLVAWAWLASGARPPAPAARAVAPSAEAPPATYSPTTVDLNLPSAPAGVTSPFPASPPAPYVDSTNPMDPMQPRDKPAEDKLVPEQPAADPSLHPANPPTSGS